MKRLLMILVPLILFVSPAFAALSLVAHATATAAAGGTATTAAMNTTGATLLVLVDTDYAFDPSTSTVSDSKSNTWVHLTAVNSGANMAIWYVANPTVGTSHTVSAVGSYTGISVAAFSGVTTTTPFDQQNGNGAASGSTIQAGSVTPSLDGELIIAGLGMVSLNSPYSINSSFSIADQVAYASGNNMGFSLAYFVQTSAAAINPTWTTTGSTSGLAACIASFKASAGPPPGQFPRAY